MVSLLYGVLNTIAFVSLDVLCKKYSRLMLSLQNSAYITPNNYININSYQKKIGNIMKKANVLKFDDGVKISFTGDVKKQNVVEMVQRCQTGQCDCMSDESKQKIEGMEVSGEDGNIELSIKGDLDVSEIEQAVSKSPLIAE